MCSVQILKVDRFAVAFYQYVAREIPSELFITIVRLLLDHHLLQTAHGTQNYAKPVQS